MILQGKRKKRKHFKVGICGHFGGNEQFLDGQTVKTKNITKELKRKLGIKQVIVIDTYGGIRSLPQCLFGLYYMLRNCDNIIILPAHNSVKIFPKFLVAFNQFYHRRLHYIVIGGWLPEFLKRKPFLGKSLKKFDGIYVETSTMKQALELQSFRNVFILPNCKELDVLKEEELVYSYAEPLRLCTFSRVMKEKGIEDAVNAVIEANGRLGRNVFSLDIYGQIDNDYRDEFAGIQQQFPKYITYKGVVPFDKSVEVLKDYYALLFPTRFYTEGIPGTIIDAYASGIPVISSKWESFSDVIEDKKTGLGYEFGNKEDLIRVLEDIVNAPELIIQMKRICLCKAKQFMPKEVISRIRL